MFKYDNSHMVCYLNQNFDITLSRPIFQLLLGKWSGQEINLIGPRYWDNCNYYYNKIKNNISITEKIFYLNISRVGYKIRHTTWIINNK